MSTEPTKTLPLQASDPDGINAVVGSIGDAITTLTDALRSAMRKAADAEHHAKQQIKDAFAAGVEAGIRIARSQA